MQVGINVMCMYTSFGGCGLPSFGDMATFQKRPNFPFGAWTIIQNINRSESAQKIYASRDLSSTCTPILVGVVSPVLEIKLAYCL